MYPCSLSCYQTLGEIAVATNKKMAVKSSKVKKSGTEKKTSKARVELTSVKSEEKTITLNRRANQQQDRRLGDRRQKSAPVAVERRVCERRVKVNRRRQIDPTTCERDYSLAEIEFMNAMEEYKRTSGRMFPTCSEVLEVLLKLGYEKRLTQDTSPTNPIVELVLTPDTTLPIVVF
jgi:hypothetical protein